jgi:ABC-type uncharacterized transport system permease subunit
VEVSYMLQGAILLCALAGELFVRYRLRLRSSSSPREKPGVYEEARS